jgi:hypothetical protein
VEIVSIEIRRTELGGNIKDFLDVVDMIYAQDPNYVRSLDFDIKGRLSPKSPFWQHAEGTIFTAYRDGAPAGRITAQIDRSWNDRYGTKAGFFGFLDTIEDQSVCTALLRAAEEFCRGKEMTEIIGPMSLNSNEEMGCLIDGFDKPPMVFMPHHRTYQGRLIEGAGYVKEKDVFAWRYVVGPLPPRAQRANEAIRALPEVTCRHIDKTKIEREVELVMEIFNDAWSEHWGFVPLTRAELKKLADDFKLILVPELTFIVSIDGEPAAFAIAVPNLNEHLRGLSGKLFPTGALSLLWGLKVKGTKTARLALLGVRKKFRSTKKYGALSTYMYAELAKSGQRLGIDWGELSWTLEDNTPVNLGIKLMGGTVYKTYRVYKKGLV